MAEKPKTKNPRSNCWELSFKGLNYPSSEYIATVILDIFGLKPDSAYMQKLSDDSDNCKTRCAVRYKGKCNR